MSADCICRKAEIGLTRADMSFVTATLSTVIFSSAAFGRWAFVTGRLRRDRRRKKRICRTADRLDQAGMPGLRRRVGRAASLPAPQIVSKILQRGSHALIAEQGCAGFARCSGRWPHSLPADPGRIAPSIRPDLISRRHRQLFLKSCSTVCLTVPM
jgi:hypothetical protein